MCCTGSFFIYCHLMADFKYLSYHSIQFFHFLLTIVRALLIARLKVIFVKFKDSGDAILQLIILAIILVIIF